MSPEQRRALGDRLKQTQADKRADKRSNRARVLWQAVLDHHASQPPLPMPTNVAELREALNSPGVFLKLHQQLISRFNEKPSRARGEFLKKTPELQLASWTGAQKCGVAVFYLAQQVSQWPGLNNLQHFQALEGSGLVTSNHWHSRVLVGGQEVLVDSTWKQFFNSTALFGEGKVAPHQQAALRRIFFGDPRFPPIFVGTLQELVNTARLLRQALLDAGLPEIPKSFISEKVTTFSGMAKRQTPPDPGGGLGES